MTRRQAKKLIYQGLAAQIQSDIDNGSEWLYCDERGEPVSEKETTTRLDAARAVMFEMERRGR